MEDTLLRVEEVALLIDSSVKTIQNWYQFKRAQPENEYAQMLPDYVQEGGRQKRYWKESDIPKLLEFKRKIPKGRNGILGCVTQKYYHKKKKEVSKNE